MVEPSPSSLSGVAGSRWPQLLSLTSPVARLVGFDASFIRFRYSFFMTYFFLSALLLLSPFVTRAQEPTTPAEYELVTHHLTGASLSDSGLPAGYRLTNSTTSTSGQFTIVLADLVRQSDHSLAAIVIQMRHPNWPAPRYLCLPNAAGEAALQPQYMRELGALTPGNTQAVATALAQRTLTLSSVLPR
jgi:hypothetical protein